jgi:hypothetical protein
MRSWPQTRLFSVLLHQHSMNPCILNNKELHKQGLLMNTFIGNLKHELSHCIAIAVCFLFPYPSFPENSSDQKWNGPMGPCAHVVFHDKIYVDFTDLWTVIEFTQHSRLYSYWTCTKCQVNSLSGYKTCPANGPRRILTSVTLKSWSNQKHRHNVMYSY